ncbi:MAG: hypothetical protein JO214_13275 [Frankiaceae bacterium]|nr:hypothetical protein [Frankiaceae bacterium]
MSRWKRSAVTFGPAGRVLATVVALLPVWWLVGVNIPGLAMSYQIGWLFAGFLYTVFVAPMILRDVWKRVPDRDRPPVLDLPSDPGPPAPGESISDRAMPPRW